MTDLDKQLLQLREEYHRDANKSMPVGVLGKGDSSGTVTDTAVPGNVWVREWTASGYSVAISVVNALPPGQRIWSGMGVVIGYKNGQRAIVDIDREAIKAADGNPGALPSPYTAQESITTLLVRPTNPPSLYVQVLGGNFVDSGTTYFLQTTDGSTDNPHVNLTSLIPGAGEHCYGVVYLQDDYATFEAFASTAQSTLLPLEEADTDECHVQASDFAAPLWAIRLHDDQTEITNDDIYTQGKDLRAFFNISQLGRSDSPVRKIMTGKLGHVLVGKLGHVLVRR